MLNELGIENLGNAVVLQAVKDFRSAREGYFVDGKSPQRVMKEVERFFLSDRFNIFSKLDGKELFERLKNEDAKDAKLKQISH